MMQKKDRLYISQKGKNQFNVRVLGMHDDIISISLGTKNII